MWYIFFILILSILLYFYFLGKKANKRRLKKLSENIYAEFTPKVSVNVFERHSDYLKFSKKILNYTATAEIPKFDKKECDRLMDIRQKRNLKPDEIDTLNEEYWINVYYKNQRHGYKAISDIWSHTTDNLEELPLLQQWMYEILEKKQIEIKDKLETIKTFEEGNTIHSTGENGTLKVNLKFQKKGWLLNFIFTEDNRLEDIGYYNIKDQTSYFPFYYKNAKDKIIEWATIIFNEKTSILKKKLSIILFLLLVFSPAIAQQSVELTDSEAEEYSHKYCGDCILPDGYKPISKSPNEKFYKKHDKFNDITFYEHKESFKLSDGIIVPVSLYISKDEKGKYLFLLFQYQSERTWLFFNEVIFINDQGKKLKFEIPKNEKKENFHSGIYEAAHILLNKETAKIFYAFITTSIKIEFRLQGKYYKEFTMTNDQHSAIIETFEFYEKLK